MNDFKMTSKVKKIALIEAIAFATYNIVTFVLCGFAGHGATFWISYGFMLLAFAVVTGEGCKLKSRVVQPKDWFLGYPVLRHSAIYIAAELCLSVLFIALDSVGFAWWIAFVAQLIVLSVHAVFVISCFIVQETIEEVQTKVKDATFFIKLLQADVEMVAEKSDDPTVKESFKKLAEQVRYSDPMSNQNLFELEKQITLQVSKADGCVANKDVEGAIECCKQAALLLTERNKKCKVLK